MKSRFTIATVTLLGLPALLVACLVVYGLHERQARAQQLQFRDVPADAASAAVHRVVEPYQSRTPAAPSYGTTYQSGPPPALSVASRQPIVVDIMDGPQLSGEPVGPGSLPGRNRVRSGHHTG